MTRRAATAAGIVWDGQRLAPVAIRVGILLVMPCHAAGAGGAGPGRPAFGFLRLNVVHDPEMDDCLARQGRFVRFEDSTETADRLARLGAVSDLAVLHRDRAIPWFVFDEDAPAPAERVAFYDALLDAPTVAWRNAWTVESGVLPQTVQQLFDIWPCSGSEDVNGNLEPARAALLVPGAASGGAGRAVVLTCTGLARARGKRHP